MSQERIIVLKALSKMEEGNIYSNILIGKFLQESKDLDVGFVRELFYGVLRNKLYLDYILNQYIKSGVEKLRPVEKNILRIGLYSMLYMNSIPDYAAVNESVELAKKFVKGKVPFINGVLRNVAKREFNEPSSIDNVEYLSSKYSWNSEVIKLLLGQYDFKFLEDMLIKFNSPLPIYIRANRLKIGADELREKLIGEGFEVAEETSNSRCLMVRGTGLLDTELYKSGFFSVQDKSSQMMIEDLDVEEVSNILDCCSAPGGKTFNIAERLNGRGEILALDIYENKVSSMKKEKQRLGIDNVSFMTWDSRQIIPGHEETKDLVLVDAPCSGLGVVSGKPEIKSRTTLKDIHSLVAIQDRLLNTAAKYVGYGKTLVYSTCTITNLENDQVVNRFLAGRNDFKLIRSRQFYPHIDLSKGFYYAIMKRET